MIAALLGLALVFVGANPAAAHAVVVDVVPEPDSVLSDSISEVRVSFNEPVSVEVEGIEVLDDSGSPVSGRAESQNTDAVFIADADFGEGTHLVSWRVVSDDGHPITGAFTFSVGQKTQAPQVADSSDFNPVEPAVWVAQALIYLGLLLTAGLVMFEAWCLRDASDLTVLRARLALWRRRAALIGIVGLVAYVPVFTLWQRGLGWSKIVDGAVWASASTSDAAWASFAGIIGLIVALVAHRLWVAARVRVRPNMVAAILVAVGLIIALGSQLVVGHTRTISPTWLVMASDLVHLFVAAFWIGGVFGLILVLRTLQLPDAAGVIVARFSRAAIWVVAVLAATGLVLGWRILGGFGPLFTTRYGLLLLAKLALIALVIVFAAWNHRRLVPAIVAETGTDRAGALSKLRRSVAFEAALLAAAVAVTGVLVSQSPQEDSGPFEIVEHHDFAEASLHLEIKEMGYLGRHFEFQVLKDGELFAPETVPELTMFLPDKDIGPLAVKVNEIEPGDFGAHFDAPFEGDWQTQLSIRTSKFSQNKVEVDLRID